MSFIYREFAASIKDADGAFIANWKALCPSVDLLMVCIYIITLLCSK